MHRRRLTLNRYGAVLWSRVVLVEDHVNAVLSEDDSRNRIGALLAGTPTLSRTETAKRSYCMGSPHSSHDVYRLLRTHLVILRPLVTVSAALARRGRFVFS